MVAVNTDFLNKGPITPKQILEAFVFSQNDDIGSHVIFLGKVRADFVDKKKVIEIEYSAYEPLVEVEMKNIFIHIASKYNDLKILTVIHSIGKVMAGENSLIVQAGCGHRNQAFRVVEELVTLIKLKLPIWKKEIFEDGTYIWTQQKY